MMKKVYTRSGWKTQYGGSFMEDIPMTPKYLSSFKFSFFFFSLLLFLYLFLYFIFCNLRYQMWADECSKCLGGLEIFALDALHGVDGKYALPPPLPSSLLPLPSSVLCPPSSVLRPPSHLPPSSLPPPSLPPPLSRPLPPPPLSLPSSIPTTYK